LIFQTVPVTGVSTDIRMVMKRVEHV